MRFLTHGDIHPDALAAMTKHEQKCEPLDSLAPDSEEDDTITESPTSPQALLPLLQKKQLQLLTTDTKFIADLYEQKILFPGIIVLLLESEGTQADAIDRLFERYPRLSPRRLYTVTGSRVKIRQLPGAAQA
jgi:hypothetical protein